MTAVRVQAETIGPEQEYHGNPSSLRWDWADRFRAADPGATRLLLALQVVVTIAVAMAAEDVLVRLTGALQIDTHGASCGVARGEVSRFGIERNHARKRRHPLA